MAKSITEHEFIARANKAHNNKYSYTDCGFRGMAHKVAITCPIHGVFEQRAAAHANYGSGCGKCVHDALRITVDSFITRSNVVHCNKYQYDNVVYVNQHTKVLITCGIHGDFSQVPLSHLSGNGCSLCDQENRKHLTTEEFLIEAEQVHGQYYDYSLVNVVTKRDKVVIICPIHGEFEQSPFYHLRGHHCVKCGNSGVYCDTYFDRNPLAKQFVAVLYKLKFTSNDEIFYKTGITTNIRQRLYELRQSGYNIEIVEQVTTTLYDAYQQEQVVLSKVMKYEPKNKFGGWTECYIA